MSKADAVAVVLWVGATMYAIFGGADFGAGLWSLLAGGGSRGRRPRELIDWAIGPVWEANHVWLIFVLVVLWTGFSSAFEAIFSTLFIPLSLAALGIVFRGAGFAFHKTAGRLRGRGLAESSFGLASLLTPFFMGTVVGAIAGGRVPVGNAAGDAVTSWLNPLSLLIGALFVATSAYLAAVFLVSDARRADTPDLERYFRVRALAAAVVAGALAVGGLLVLRDDARYVYDGLTSDGLPLVILSLVCGGAALIMLWRGAVRGPRPLAIARGRRRDLGLGNRPAPLPAPQVPHHRRSGGAERDAYQCADRLRRRRRARAAVHRAPVHPGATRPRARDRGSATENGLTDAAVIAPSGDQIGIALGDQRATVVEVGGGLRTYSVGGRERPGRIRDRRDEQLRPRPGADPVAKPARGRQLRVRGDPSPAPDRRRPGAGCDSWAGPLGDLDRGRARATPGRDGAHAASPARLPVLARPGDRVSALRRRACRVTTTATNVGRVSCPFGSGAHPYLTLGSGIVDGLILSVPGRTVLRSNERGIPIGSAAVEGTDVDFRRPRAIGTTRLDNAFTDLERDDDGLARVQLRDPHGGSELTLWVDESYPYLMVFTGDPLPDVARRSLAVEPMTCPPNAFRSGTDLVRLEPGESFTGRWGVRPGQRG